MHLEKWQDNSFWCVTNIVQILGGHIGKKDSFLGIAKLCISLTYFGIS